MEQFSQQQRLYTGDEINAQLVYSYTDITTRTSNQSDIVQVAAVKRTMNQTNQSHSC